MNLNLKNKNALVCGSTQGIGKATAIALANEGVNVTLVARNRDKLKQVLAELPNSENHHFIVADFLNPRELQEQVIKFIEKNHGFHILINNTGGPPGGKIIDAEADAFLFAYNQHLICNHIITQAVVEGMKNDNYGRIVNVISTSVKIPLHGLGVSNTTRGAVASWSKTMANELTLSHYLNSSNVQKPSDAEMRGDLDVFIEITYLRFYQSKLSSLQKVKTKYR